VAAVAAWVLAMRATPATVIQPIAFNHQKHLGVGLSCDACHQHYAQQTIAGLPNTEVCMACHAAPLSESLEEEKVRAYAERGHEIPWITIHALPDHSFFSHRRHVALGKLDCAVCHGDMTQRTAPVTAPAVKLTMAWCVGCHTQRNVTTDCSACHK